MSPATADIAMVGVDRQLYRLAPGGEPQQLTGELDALMMWGAAPAPRSWSWPCWSPDGQQLACFQFPAGDDVSGPARVMVLDREGMQQRELLELSGRIPVYGWWRPDGAGLALLLQAEDHLVLGYCGLDRLGRLRVLEQGSPLFFSWADRRRLAVHSATPGQPDSSRLTLRDALGELPAEVLPQHPGKYCTPLRVGDWLVQVEQSGDNGMLMVSDLHGGAPRQLAELRGLGAVVPVPGRDQVVFSAADAPRGPYRGAVLADLATGALTRLSDQGLLAFFWNPGGAELITVRVNRERNCLTWGKVRAGESPTELADFWPSRDQMFYFQFFEQFVQSHPLVSPDGRHLLFSGHLSGQDRASEPAQVLLLDLRRNLRPQALAAGHFATFSSAP